MPEPSGGQQLARNSGPDASQIGAWLKAAREEQGAYSQEGAAHAVGATVRNLWNWENGKHAPPSDRFLALVKLYRAEKKLLVLLGNWEKFRGAGAGAADRPSKAAGG